MSDIPRVNSGYKRKKSEGHQVMQNLEASSLASFKTTEDSENISGAAKKGGNSSDNGSPPTKKKKRTHKPRKVIKGQPRETPCPVGQAVELGQQLQNFALHIVDSQSADERATQVEWLQRAKAAKASLTADQEMPSVAPNQGSQSASEELDPASSSNMPPVGRMERFSTVPTHPIQSGFAAPQYPPAVQSPEVLQSIPAGGFAHYLIGRLESTLNRVAAGFEANNRLIRQILAQGDQNTNTPVDFNS
ncbi:hypothetical protein CEK26_000321 [Fusarium fujikuroi]|nr:hypothetical protein CEK27_000318 [Fusarium fujikuroi]QGI89106.1 hypothetical protein CEK26_000321 [Fusarium fujikuroi]